MASKLPTLVTVKDAASTLSLSEKSIRRMLRDGRLRAHHIGRNVRVDISSTAMPQQEAPSTASQEHQMPNEQDPGSDTQLGVPLKRGNEQTMTLPFDVRIPLGTDSTSTARNTAQRTLQMFQELQTKGATPKDLGIVVVRNKGTPCFIRYPSEDGGPKVSKRIPSEISRELKTTEQVAVFSLGWAAFVASSISTKAQLATVNRHTCLTNLAELWFDGHLADKYPAHLTKKRSAKEDASRYRRYIAPVVGNSKVAELSGDAVLNAADDVSARMQELSPDLSSASRRQVVQLFRRLINIAVFPVRLLKSNDLPKGYVPKARQLRAFNYLRPSEDALLMKCTKVPVNYRLFFGLLAREGLRASELLHLTWRDVDLDVGTLKLDENKTQRPRSWMMRPDSAEALRRYKQLLGHLWSRKARLVIHPESGCSVPEGKAAKQLRTALKMAGVTREELFEETQYRMAIRGHDLRATFVTLALADGKSEAWISDRTGHESSQMIRGYQRMARTHAEARLGQLDDMTTLIPELSELKKTKQRKE